MQNCFCFRPNPGNKHLRDREDIEDRVYLSILLKKKKKKKNLRKSEHTLSSVSSLSRDAVSH